MSFQKEYSDYLMHYGTPGMKWGVRRQRAALGKMRRKAAKNRSLLSDKELQDRINRLRKEKELKDLTEQEVSPGRTAFKRILKSTAIAAASAAATGATMYALSRISKGFYKTSVSKAGPLKRPKTKFSFKKMGESFSAADMFNRMFGSKK